ncbi:hypothetical protein FGO68_gene17514 [Halteria grandinella]|uniref:Protein kinase domain-containing protein n=1 Tax=Halteria grandinella TaxID=5974 RepID=A0A8J8P4U5_HALGN|nr:hypothetical protein FGO68_gene17514 [Halteria grandinella]
MRIVQQTQIIIKRKFGFSEVLLTFRDFDQAHQLKKLLDQVVHSKKAGYCLSEVEAINQRYAIDYSNNLGQGSYGTVLRGVDKKTGQLVAVKHVSKVGVNKDTMSQLKQELETLRVIHQQGKNQGVVQVLDIAECKENILIVMEFLDGGTLQQWLKGHKIAKGDRIKIFLYLCETIASFHELGIAHRDLKMENIIFEEKTKLPKIIDFGLSKIFLQGQTVSATVGTLEFMAPEVLKGEFHNHLCDIWSIGVIGYIIMTGRHPFNLGLSETELMHSIAHGHPSQLDLQLIEPQQVRSVITSMLTKEPSKRISAKEAVKILHNQCGL